QDHHLHAELVHQAKPAAVQVEDAFAHFDPDVVGKETLRIVQRIVDGKVLFEADLAFHGAPPVSSTILIATHRKAKAAPKGGFSSPFEFGGARRNRTADLLNAIQALSQLSYGPALGSTNASTFFKNGRRPIRNQVS